MNIDKMDSSAVYGLFEELKHKITELGSKSIQNVQSNPSIDSNEVTKLLNELQNLTKQKQFTPEQVEELRENIGGFAAGLLKKSNEKIDELFTEVTSFFNQIEERIKALNIPMNFVIRKEHSFSIDFKNSKATIAMIVMGLAILISISINVNQYRNNKTYKNTDLKYRFIKMYRGISTGDLIWLENIFYSDSAYVVKNIKKQVLDYEHRLEQQVRKQEQIRMNNEKNKQLNNEIKDLKVK